LAEKLAEKDFSQDIKQEISTVHEDVHYSLPDNVSILNRLVEIIK
jgi:hypothetical protein